MRDGTCQKCGATELRVYRNRGMEVCSPCAEQMRAEGHGLEPLEVGDRVVTVGPIDRYPHFILEPGHLATVTSADPDPTGSVWILPDIPLGECAQEWGGEVCIQMAGEIDDRDQVVRIVRKDSPSAPPAPPAPPKVQDYEVAVTLTTVEDVTVIIEANCEEGARRAAEAMSVGDIEELAEGNPITTAKVHEAKTC